MSCEFADEPSDATGLFSYWERKMLTVATFQSFISPSNDGTAFETHLPWFVVSNQLQNS